jgi:hypothetical protein
MAKIKKPQTQGSTSDRGLRFARPAGQAFVQAECLARVNAEPFGDNREPATLYTLEDLSAHSNALFSKRPLYAHGRPILATQYRPKGSRQMTAPKMDDEDIERMIDTIGDGELTAEAQERLHREGLWPLYESLRKRPSRPLSATQVGSRASDAFPHQAALPESADVDPQAYILLVITDRQRTACLHCPSIPAGAVLPIAGKSEIPEIAISNDGIDSCAPAYPRAARFNKRG